MRTKVIAFTLMAFSGIVSANSIHPFLYGYLSQRAFIEPASRPEIEKCGPDGQLISEKDFTFYTPPSTESENPNSSLVSAFCEDLRVARDEGRVLKANYYQLKEAGKKLASPIYGCSINTDLSQYRYPALCTAKAIPSDYTAYAFQEPHYRNQQTFDGRPLAVKAGGEARDVSIQSFNLPQNTQVIAYSAPNFTGQNTTITVPSETTPFIVRSFRVEATNQ